MSTPIPFNSLLDIDGVMGAVRWRESVPGKGAATPPFLIEHIGDISEDRADRLMAHAEAAGLGVMGISQLSYQRASHDPTVVYPLDAYYLHSMRGSVVCTINRVAVLLDNKIKTDIQSLISQMILIDNL
ncbi:MAG: hypothetical protein KBT50_00705 [Cycloclasticus sp.]|nr:hypothetical protein [Cycloclasticus sp.]MBQ0789111.1 hypothetical protein [Cycloclasticus sp.]